MPALTRRPHPERSDCWHVYYDDVQVGTIAVQSGLPITAPQWRWDVGFYPLTHRGRMCAGYAPSFELARSAFEAAWKDLPQCTEADLVEYRRQRPSRRGKMPGITLACRCPRNWPVNGRAVSVVPRLI
jgi:hypothetical protein